MKKALILIEVIVIAIFIASCANNPKIGTGSNANVITNLSDCLNNQIFVSQGCKCDPGYMCDCAKQISACEYLARSTNNTETLSFLSDTRDESTLVAVINNKYTTREILTHIYYRTDLPKEYLIYPKSGRTDVVKEAIASNLNTDPVILAELGNYTLINKTENSIEYSIFRHVALNPNTPAETLRSLIYYDLYEDMSSDNWILSALIKNPSISKDMLIFILDYTNDSLRIGEIALLPNVSKEVLLKIIKEKGNLVHNPTFTLRFGDNILQVQDEILGMEDYYKEHFPIEYDMQHNPIEAKYCNSSNCNYEYLIAELANNPKATKSTLDTIIERNYTTKVRVLENNEFVYRTPTQLAQENLEIRGLK